jgi:hypothetical protein
MVLLRLFGNPSVRVDECIHITMDAVTASNLGAALMNATDEFLNQDRIPTP